MNRDDTSIYVVAGKKTETPRITTLHLKPQDASRPTFTSGQFLTVYFPDLGASEGKAYSISSAPHEEGFSITVKDIGVFSHKLSALEIGDTLIASGPYGFFYSEEEDSPLVFLAGGIGVAPFRGMVMDVLHKNPSRKVSLHYSVPSSEEAAFGDLFSSLEREHPHFTCTVNITRGPSGNPDHKEGRISIEELMSCYGDNPSVEYLMCGSIPFVRDMWKGLRSLGVPEQRLYTEAFFG